MSRGPSPLNSARRSCPFGTCDGSGWIFGPEDVARPCECRGRRLTQARSRGVAREIPEKFRGVSFDRPPISTTIDRGIVEYVRGYVESLDENLATGRGLWFIGDVGTGKTTLAMLVSRLALEAGRSVAIYSLPRLLSRIRRTYSADQNEDSYLAFFDKLTSVDLLHIDDLGAERRTDWVIEQLYAIVNERYERERAMLVTTNVEKEDREGKRDPLGACLDRLEGIVGGRTVSRLIEICGDPLPMFGPDLRMVG
jgi:DNA replication protein DnaC